MKLSEARNAALGSVKVHDHEIMVAAQCDVSVLITSEHQDERFGWARSIHAQDSRRSAPLIECDCRRWRPLEGTGHRDTTTDRDSVNDLRSQFRRASNGTLFLDRIETMSAAVQAELFCLLDEITRHSNVPSLTGICRPRLITGASRSLPAAIAAGTFDESLFYRLNVIHLDLTNTASKEDS